MLKNCIQNCVNCVFTQNSVFFMKLIFYKNVIKWNQKLFNVRIINFSLMKCGSRQLNIGWGVSDFIMGVYMTFSLIKSCCTSTKHWGVLRIYLGSNPVARQLNIEVFSEFIWDIYDFLLYSVRIINFCLQNVLHVN